MYGDSHVKDKTAGIPRDPYTGKTTYLYWDGPLYVRFKLLRKGQAVT